MNPENPELYQARHFIENQETMDGIPIDPIQRQSFDITPNDDRPQREIDEWWDVKYIVTQSFGRDTYQEYSKRVENPDPEKQWTNDRKERKKRWLENYPDGYRYTVRCLDGGAWDRSTNQGSCGSLNEAIEIINGDA